jgi:hypothetical protein
MKILAQSDIEKLIYRILLGYYYIFIDNIKYKITYPTLQLKYDSQILYDEIIENNKFDKRFLTQDEIDLYLRIYNFWNKKKEEELEKTKKILDDLKIDLYLNYRNEKKKESIKSKIKAIDKSLEELYALKNTMSHLSIENYAMSIKNEYLIINTIYFKDKLFFKNTDTNNCDNKLLQSFIREIVEYTLDPSILRQVAKSDLWKSYANICDLKVDFNVNDDYRHLIGLYKMFDNVRQHPECPTEDIINDDDALDGWFIYQHQKAEKEKKKNAILDKVGGNTKKAGEVFLLTDDVTERNDIYDLNDLNTRQNIKEIIAIGKNNPEAKVAWQDLGFVQRDLKQKVQEKISTRKG